MVGIDEVGSILNYQLSNIISRSRDNNNWSVMQKQGQVLQFVITNLKAKSILYTVDDFSNVINALFQFSFPIAYFQLFITV